MEEKKSLFTKIKEKFTKKKIIALIAILVIAALAIPLILPFVMMKTQSSKKPFQNVGTRTTILKKQVLNDSVSVTGTVKSTQTVNVTCTLNGYTVSEILIQEGDKVKEGDVITLKETSRNLPKIKAVLEANESKNIPKWLDLDTNTMQAKVVTLSSREDIDVEIKEHLIVELYSK